MSNIHGLHSNKGKDSDDEEDSNNRYVGGVTARGGGSGLAVEPNPEHGDSSSNPRDVSRSIFNLASAADAGSGGTEPIQRTITMYRDGFVVDDGPYRRLNDPSNAEFLHSLATGQTPRELSEGNNGKDISVGLIDKRSEDYVETFRSFSGVGSSLGSATSAENESSTSGTTGIIVPVDYVTPSESRKGSSSKVVGIQVRLLSGRRIVARLPVDSAVHALVDEIQSSGAAGTDTYALMSGFPPVQITDFDQTIDEAKLGGATVTQKKK